MLLLIAIVMIMGGVVTLRFYLSLCRKKCRWHIWELQNPVKGVELINKAGDTLTRSSIIVLVDGIDRTRTGTGKYCGLEDIKTR